MVTRPDEPDVTIIYCDGSSRGNPGPGGWGSLIATTSWVRELGGLSWQTTNNQMELAAAIEALRFLQLGSFPTPTQKIEIFTDSKYLIQGATLWGHGWKRNGWLTKEGTPVLNQGYWQDLFEILAVFKERRVEIVWNHVPGHAGVVGNERVDVIATSFAKNDEPYLFDGSLKEYAAAQGFSFTELLAAKDLVVEKKEKSKSAKSPRAASNDPLYPRYVSLTRGEFLTHKSWPECQNRVAGVSGAKYKKVQSSAEELAVKKSWGLGD